MFVHYAGQTVELVDSRTGEIRRGQVLVAVMVASSYLYAEASWTQILPDWIGSHVRALAFMACGRAGARQSQGWGRSRQLVEPGAQSYLSRAGDPLWHGHSAGASAEAARQGEVGVGVLVVQTLDSGAARKR